MRSRCRETENRWVARSTVCGSSCIILQTASMISRFSPSTSSSSAQMRRAAWGSPCTKASRLSRTIRMAAAAMALSCRGDPLGVVLRQEGSVLGDVDCLIAHAFEVVIDLHDGSNESQIFSHRLVESQQLQAFLFEFDFSGVHLLVAFHHLSGD